MFIRGAARYGGRSAIPSLYYTLVSNVGMQYIELLDLPVRIQLDLPCDHRSECRSRHEDDLPKFQHEPPIEFVHLT